MKCKKCSEQAVVGKVFCDICAKKNRLKTKEWREKRRLQGLCDCGSPIVNEGGIYCSDCLIKQRKRRQGIVDDGLCVDCHSNLAAVGKKRCVSCLEKRKLHRQKLKEQGVCTVCRKSSVHSESMCLSCLDKKKKFKQKCKSRGVCSNCGKNVSKIGSTYCESCLFFFRQRRKTFDEQGLCVKCGQERVDRSKWCEKCYLKETSFRHLGTNVFHEKLKNLFEEQNGTCPYTGLRLVLGRDTDLDHITPKSKGGSDSLVNFQWTHSCANRMKGDQTEEDFLNYIKMIYKHRIEHRIER